MCRTKADARLPFRIISTEKSSVTFIVYKPMIDVPAGFLCRCAGDSCGRLSVRLSSCPVIMNLMCEGSQYSQKVNIVQLTVQLSF